MVNDCLPVSFLLTNNNNNDDDDDDNQKVCKAYRQRLLFLKKKKKKGRMLFVRVCDEIVNAHVKLQFIVVASYE